MNEVKEAMDVITRAIKEDPGYAIAWHSNIAIAFMDEAVGVLAYKVANEIGNRGADRFMKVCFDVKVKYPGDEDG